MRDGELDGQDQESKGQKPPCFLCQSQPQIVRAPVSRFEALCGTPMAGWHPYTSRAVKRGVGPRVACCEQMWKSPWDWVRKGLKNRPQPARHFFARFFGPGRRSILQQDKAVASPRCTSSRNAGRKGRSRANSENPGTFPVKSGGSVFYNFGHLWLLASLKRLPLSGSPWRGDGSFAIFT